MAEARPALDPTAAPQIDEAVATRPRRGYQAINHRKALAGLYFLNGYGSLAACLVRAGYSRVTAKNQLKNGLTAEHCFEETKKLEGASDPVSIVSGVRRRVGQAIELADPATVDLAKLARLWEIAEKYYGARETPNDGGLPRFNDRLMMVQQLIVVLQERGVALPQLAGTVTLEAKAVPSCDSAERSAESTPTSDNAASVNSEKDRDDEESREGS